MGSEACLATSEDAKEFQHSSIKEDSSGSNVSDD